MTSSHLMVSLRRSFKVTGEESWWIQSLGRFKVLIAQIVITRFIQMQMAQNGLNI